MSTVEKVKVNARREELQSSMDTLRAELAKIEELRTNTIGQMQQLSGAIQILNELLSDDSKTTETSPPDA